MEINKVVYMCKDDHSLLDDMLRNKEITISDYQKAKMILDDEELCQMSCLKYEQSLTAADKLTSTIKNFDTEAAKGSAKEALSSDKVKKFKPLAVIAVIALIAAGGYSFYKTFIYKVPIDLGKNVIVKIDKAAFSGEAGSYDFEMYSNYDYYNESGFYDDMKTSLENNGLSKKEAESLVPTYDQETYDYVENLEFTPEFSKTTNIKNGDEITINYTYNKDYAKQNNIKVKNNTKTVEVSGLRERVTEDNYKTADTTTLQNACDKNLSKTKLNKYINNYGNDDTTINKIGTCGFAVEKYSGDIEGPQEGVLFVEVNTSDDYDDSSDETYKIYGDMYVKDGNYKFIANKDYNAGVQYDDEDFQENLTDNNYLLIKKAENVDMDSDN